MKKFLASAAVAFAFYGAPAFAADMPVKTPVYKAAPAPLSWTGFYIGAEGGGAWFDSRVDFVAGGPVTRGPSVSDSSGIIGATVGYNWQSGLWVAGLEADWSWMGLKATNTTAANCAPGSCANKLDWLATARLRAGYTITPNTMIYATGGAAFGDLGTRLTFGGGVPAPVESMEVKTGWTAGGGIESMLNEHWTAKVEYLYVGLPNGPNRFNGVLTVDHAADVRTQIVRAGLNYKF